MAPTDKFIIGFGDKQRFWIKKGARQHGLFIFGLIHIGWWARRRPVFDPDSNQGRQIDVSKRANIQTNSVAMQTG